MAKKSDGYILLYRSIQDNPVVWNTGEPFTKRDAWIDLLLLTQHSSYKGLKRGQCRLSQMWLADRWQWSRHKVRNYLGQLVGQGMVTIEGTTQGTTLTIVNYGFYQSSGPAKGTTKGTTNGPANGTQTNNVITKNEETKGQGQKHEPIMSPWGIPYEE